MFFQAMVFVGNMRFNGDIARDNMSARQSAATHALANINRAIQTSLQQQRVSQLNANPTCKYIALIVSTCKYIELIVYTCKYIALIVFRCKYI